MFIQTGGLELKLELEKPELNSRRFRPDNPPAESVCVFVSKWRQTTTHRRKIRLEDLRLSRDLLAGPNYAFSPSNRRLSWAISGACNAKRLQKANPKWGATGANCTCRGRCFALVVVFNNSCGLSRSRAASRPLRHGMRAAGCNRSALRAWWLCPMAASIVLLQWSKFSPGHSRRCVHHNKLTQTHTQTRRRTSKGGSFVATRVCLSAESQCCRCRCLYCCSSVSPNELTSSVLRESLAAADRHSAARQMARLHAS